MRDGSRSSCGLVARGLVRGALAGLLAVTWALPGRAQSTSAAQWRPWEQIITSKKEYYLSGAGNPYKDVILTVTYTNAATGKSFKRYGFWEGGKTFKIRAAFPPGTWNWTTSCASTAGTTDCSTGETAASGSDTGLIHSGTVTVSGFLISDHPAAELWNRGFPQPSTDNRYLLYGDGVTPFFWMADTAWTAASLAPANTAEWNSYLSDRFNKKFTVVLLGLAPKYTWVNPAPVAFEQVAGCSSTDPVPNKCSRWIPAYWQKLDNLVQTANTWGQLVMLTGLNDPYDLGTKNNPGQYPWGSDAVVFARNLAARMAGNFVIYSPSFDDSKDAIHGGETQETVMKAVAGALVPAQPANPETRTRQLVTMHLAGGSQYGDYSSFQNNVNLHVFHSGHAFNSSICQTGESQAQCSLRRAREMPLALGNYSETTFSPLRPITNGEALYDAAGSTRVEPDNADRVRQAGYLTTLSGAFGYTLGVGRLTDPVNTTDPIKGIFPWVNPTSYFNTKSAEQMGFLRTVFYNRPWKDLQPKHCNPITATCGNLITNQGTAADQKMVVAVTTNLRYAIAYMPNNAQLDLECGSFSNFLSRWSKQWLNPTTGIYAPITVNPPLKSGTASVYQFVPPLLCTGSTNGPDGKCDWVLILQDSCPTCASVNVSPGTASLQLWQGQASAEKPAGIVAQAFTSDGKTLGPRIDVSSTLPGNHKLPQLARERGGKFLAAWQAEGPDGSLWGVFGRIFGRSAQPEGEPFQINSFWEHDQSDPSVAEAAGGFIATWTSYGQDGDMGGIYARRIGESGRLGGGEFSVHTTTAGHQGFSQVGADVSGNFVVAWESRQEEVHTIYFQRFDRQGARLGEETAVVTSTDGLRELVSLNVDPLGDFTVAWQSYDEEGGDLGRYVQKFSSAGSAIGEALRAPLPAD